MTKRDKKEYERKDVDCKRPQERRERERERERESRKRRLGHPKERISRDGSSCKV
jgi:hypothetical protein